jgi:hypothetical protein
MQMAALVLTSALLGAGGVVVKDQVQEARRQELLLAEVAGNQRIAEMEVELLERQYQDVEERYGAGLVDREALLAARLAVARAELRLTRLRLDEEEIRGTGREPRNDLSAPLVGGRDLVTERLALDVSAAMEEITAARARLQHVQQLHGSGVVGDAELIQAMVPVQELESRVRDLDRRMELRRGVLAGEVSARAAEREIEINEVRAEMEVLQGTRESAALRLQQLQEQVRLGLARTSELGGARLHLIQLETRIELLQLRLQMLEAGDPGP